MSEENKITDDVNSVSNQGDPEKGNTNNGDAPSDTTADPGGLVVYWEQPESEDPENPLNWSSKRKWAMIGILSFLSLLV